MKSRYGEFTDKQFKSYKEKLHSMIHWLLIYKEENKTDVLNGYFDTVQRKLQGLNTLLDNPVEMVELSVTIECARNEFNKGNDCDHAVYRKLILNAHSLIDQIEEGVDGRIILDENEFTQKHSRQ